jgi:serine protease AprX
MRESVLWGRRGGRLAIAVAALTVGLAVPAAGVAGNGDGNGKGRDKGTVPSVSAAVPQDLLAQAAQKPEAAFRVIVSGRRGTSTSGVTQDVGDAWAAGGGKSKLNLIRRQFASVSGVSAQLTGAQILWLAQRPDILSIVPDAPIQVADYQNDEIWRQSTAVARLWGTTAGPAPQAPAIAIIDSGIDASRTDDFGARVIARTDLVSDDQGKDPGGDPEGHGTMVAGIAAGASPTYPGVAQNAPLVDVRVAGADGSARESDVIAGVDWVLQHKDQYGIRVANLSLTGNTETSFLYDPLDQAVESLWLNGVVVVAAAGNQGLPDQPVKLSSPGNDPFVITVGALDPNQTVDPSDDFRAPWSAYGVTADGFGKPELGAPGRYMIAPVSTGAYLANEEPGRVVAPGYMWMSGTSFAAPAVAGAAAQVLARHPGWTPDQVKGALMASATQLADTTTIGVGEVNAAAAAATASPPNPNGALDQFVSTDPTTGLQTFSGGAWANAAASGTAWTASGWTSSGWTSSGWTSSGWTSSGWTSSGWTSSGWTESGWTE